MREIVGNTYDEKAYSVAKEIDLIQVQIDNCKLSDTKLLRELAHQREYWEHRYKILTGYEYF